MESPGIAGRVIKNSTCRDKKLRPSPNKVKIQQQRDKRKNRDKRRSSGTGVSYLASTEGTTSDECDGVEEVVNNAASAVQHEKSNEHGRFHVKPAGASCVQPHPAIPNSLNLHPHFNSKSQSMMRGNKSPSDLDADDEDNQEYDSASMISQSECSNLAGMAMRQATIPANAANFEAQFQQIRLAGTQQLKQRSASASGSSENGYDNSPTQPAENSKEDLWNRLNVQEEKISEMQRLISELALKLSEKDTENERLKVENRKLLRALGNP